jgi:hypothetical protein
VANTALAPVPAAEELRALAAQAEEKREAFDNGAVWVSWNELGTTSFTNCTTASTATNLNVTWSAWNTTYTSGACTFGYYDANSNQAYVIAPQWGAWNTTRQETEDERAAREKQAAEQARRHEAVRAAREAQYALERAGEAKAAERALELLRSLLSDEQWISYQEKGWFEVRGSKGGRWRIRNRGQSGNVDLMPEIGEEREATYCAHPPGSLPLADAHAAQMLALVTDEEAFVKTANVHYRRPRPQETVHRGNAHWTRDVQAAA